MNKKDHLVKLHAYISSDGRVDTWKSKDLHGKKLRVRTRFRIRFFNVEKMLIDDFIKSVKQIYSGKKYVYYPKKRDELEVRGQIITKGIFALGQVSTKNWELPKKLNKNQKAIWIRAFADCDGTVYNKNYTRYVAIDSINLKGLKQISNVLDEFGIKNKIYDIKYKGNISYRLKISKKENLIKFEKLIGFNHPKKKEKLKQAIKSYKRTF